MCCARCQIERLVSFMLLLLTLAGTPVYSTDQLLASVTLRKINSTTARQKPAAGGECNQLSPGQPYIRCSITSRDATIPFAVTFNESAGENELIQFNDSQCNTTTTIFLVELHIPVVEPPNLCFYLMISLVSGCVVTTVIVIIVAVYCLKQNARAKDAQEARNAISTMDTASFTSERAESQLVQEMLYMNVASNNPQRNDPYTSEYGNGKLVQDTPDISVIAAARSTAGQASATGVQPVPLYSKVRKKSKPLTSSHSDVNGCLYAHVLPRSERTRPVSVTYGEPVEGGDTSSWPVLDLDVDSTLQYATIL